MAVRLASPKFWAWMWLAVGAIASGACGQDLADSESHGMGGHDASGIDALAPEHSEFDVASRAAAAERESEARTPRRPPSASADSALGAAYTLARQRDAGPEFNVRREGSMVVANNAPHRFVASFAGDSMVLRETGTVGKDRGWQAVVSVDALGCPQTLTVAKPRGPAAHDAEQLNRVTQAYELMTAWYLNGPLGLEQGFEVEAPPACLEREARLVVAMTVDGLTLHQGPLDAIELRDENDATRLRYDGLFVTDAAGQVLPAELRIHGRRILIDVDAQGARFPLSIDPMWSQQAKLLSGEGAAALEFGRHASLSGDTALVAATGGFSSNGSVYVFQRSGATWTQQAKLIATDAADGDAYGFSIALAGDTAVVGARFDDDAGSSSGSAYVFVRSGISWSQQAKLTASDAASGDFFGYSASVSGDTVVVGAHGADAGANQAGSAYVFVRNGTTWTEQAKLVPSDPLATAHFGNAVSVYGTAAVVGAYENDANGTQAGAAYVFRQSGAVWSQEAKLSASDAAAFDHFGDAVSVFGDTIAVGADGNDDNGSLSGSAYVFVRNGSNWPQQAKLTASDAAAGDLFGNQVSVFGDRLLISAYQDDDSGANAGAAYVFLRVGTTWSQQVKLLALDGQAGDGFGTGASIDGDSVLIGAWGDDDAGSNTGSAYVFTLSDDPNGTACTLDDDCLSGFCRDSVCCDTDCGGGVTSDCQSCLAAQTAQSNDGSCAVVTVALTCRAGTGDPCDPGETCDGSSTVCPVDLALPDDTACDDGTYCNGTETCAAGVCGSSLGDPCAGPDGDFDCSESCDEAANTCAGADPVNSVCTDGTHIGVCSANGSCQFPGAAPCAANVDCSSGFCVEGVCCDAACNDGCGTCSAPGLAGTCTAKSAGEECRAAAGECNTSETCDGATTQCPTDSIADDGTPCGEHGGVCTNGDCLATSGSGGSGGEPTVDDDEAGCSCAVPGQADGPRDAGVRSLWLLAFGIMLSRRRREGGRGG